MLVLYSVMKNKTTLTPTNTTLLVILLLVVSVSFIGLPVTISQPSSQPLPVLFIHGYRSSGDVWNDWMEQLWYDYHVKSHAVYFSGDDECGSAQEHAKELVQIVEDFKTQTDTNRINIVAHSKGGLDARQYLANNPSNDDVANLIMIGTPNAGSPLADRYHHLDECSPAVEDLLTTAPVITVPRNGNTQYYTIASNWQTEYSPFFPYFDVNCPPPLVWFDFEGWNLFGFQHHGRSELAVPSDGIVPVRSVEEPGEFRSLGRTDNCHANQFTDEEYNKTLRVLLQR